MAAATATPRVRAATLSAPPRTTRKPASRTAAASAADTSRSAGSANVADELAEQVGRVLEISSTKTPRNAVASSSRRLDKAPMQAPTKATIPATSAAEAEEHGSSSRSGPKSAARALRPTAATTRRVATNMESSSITAAVKARPAATPAAPAAPRTRTANEPPARASTAATTSTGTKKTVNGAQSSKTSGAALPEWAQSGPESSMSMSDRYRAATLEFNAANRQLGQAARAGYLCDRAAGSQLASASGSGQELTDAGIQQIVERQALALNVLRGIQHADRTTAVQLETYGQALVERCLSLHLNRQALDLAVVARPWITRTYSAKAIPPSRQVQSGPSKALPTAKTARSKPAQATAQGKKPMPADWADTVWLPCWEDGQEPEEPTRVLMFRSMLASWIALLRLSDAYEMDLPALLKMPQITPFMPGMLNPLILAISLPRRLTVALVNQLYCQLAYLTPTMNTWLHYRQLSLCALALASTAVPSDEASRRYTPGNLWQVAAQLIEAFVKASPDSLDTVIKAEGLISALVDWCEGTVLGKAEDRALWYDGEHWLALSILWYTLARRLGKTEAVDKALSRVSVSHGLGPSTPPPATPVRPGPTLLTNGKGSSTGATRSERYLKPRFKVDKPKQDVLAAQAQLHQLEQRLLNCSKNPDDKEQSAALQSTLRSIDLNSLADGLCSLPDSADSVELLSKVVTHMRRIHRVARVLLKDDPQDNPAMSAFIPAITEWLTHLVDLTEDVISIAKVDVSASAEALSVLTSDVLLSLATSRGDSDSAARAYLCRGMDWIDSSSAQIPVHVMIDVVEGFAAAANRHAVDCWRAHRSKAAIDFCRLSCDWTRKMITIIDTAETEATVETEEAEAEMVKRHSIWNDCRALLPKRLNMLSTLLGQGGSHPAAFEASVQALQAISAKDQAKLEEGFATPAGIDLEAFPDLKNSLDTITRRVMYYAEDLRDLYSAVPHSLTTSGMRNSVVAGLADMLMSAFSSEHDLTPQIAVGLYAMGENALESCDWSRMPIRQARLLNRMLALIAMSGVGSAKFNGYANTAVKIVNKATARADDLALDAFAAELQSTTLLIVALQTYHTEADPTLKMAQWATRALDALRGLIIAPTDLVVAHADATVAEARRAPTSRQTAAPPKTPVASRTLPPSRTPRATTSRSTSASGASRVRTPAKPAASPKLRREVSEPRRRLSDTPAPVRVFDDLPRLTNLLSALASLLGMLGLTFRKVDALKVLRALVRDQTSLAALYVASSTELAAEYVKLGKMTRAETVFAQAVKISEEPKMQIPVDTVCELHVRHAHYLALENRSEEAIQAYLKAGALMSDFVEPKLSRKSVLLYRTQYAKITALARAAAAAIEATTTIQTIAPELHLTAAVRLWARCAEKVSENLPSAALGAGSRASPAPAHDDPFTAAPSRVDPADEPAKSVEVPPAQTSVLEGKHLFGLQWRTAEGFFEALLAEAGLFAVRGSASDARYYLNQADALAKGTKSTAASATVAIHLAQLERRQRKFEDAEQLLQEASAAVEQLQEPVVAETERLHGDILATAEEFADAEVAYAQGGKRLRGMDEQFQELDSRTGSPRKGGASSQRSEALLPLTLAHIYSQQALLLHETGRKDEADDMLAKAVKVSTSELARVEAAIAKGNIHLQEAFQGFKTDLFMSSLLEASIAMPLAPLETRRIGRQSARQRTEIVLGQAEDAFRSALENGSSVVPAEAFRGARLNLALLQALQTSLQCGSSAATRLAADLLATNAAITLQREMLETIDIKLADGSEDLVIQWPAVRGHGVKDSVSSEAKDDEEDEVDEQSRLKRHWSSVRSRHATQSLVPEPIDLSPLPPTWAVISITVTEDHNTLFITRHQNGYEPVVFCVPLDRQGRRENEEEEDIFTFDRAKAELHDIVAENDESGRVAKTVVTQEAKTAWWQARIELDQRLGKLLQSIEQVWLGAFKTIFNPRSAGASGGAPAMDVARIREKLQKPFVAALTATAADMRQVNLVRISDPIVECFATLSSKSEDEEIEDLVYVVLDVYNFQGIPIDTEELDFARLTLDVRQVLTEIELSRRPVPANAEPEHLFLVLDRNVQGFPWESIPALRGRPVSRIPSLPFLLDQLDMLKLKAPPPAATPSNEAPDEGHELAPALAGLSLNGASAARNNGRRAVDHRRVFYILNPSEDLSATQTRLEPLMEKNRAAGWKGIVGRKPTVLEMQRALQDYDLVLYFGHGGGEQYLPKHKLRALPQCAATMLWGCSSGVLKDQGDLDRRGVPYEYMLAGCPSLVGNLWDVTDREIDQLSLVVLNALHLDQTQPANKRIGGASTAIRRGPGILPISPLSITQAVNASRDQCKLKYLTGAAPVVYGIPTYIH